jgi:hypothetical protein
VTKSPREVTSFMLLFFISALAMRPFFDIESEIMFPNQNACSLHCMPRSWCVSSLQILYKSFTKQSILEPLAPHGLGGRICQILSEGFKSFTHPLQNGAFWSLWRLMAQEAGSARSFPKASNSSQMLHKTVYSGASGASWLRMPDLPDPLKASNP